MADADDSYDFGHIPRFLEQLREGADLVMGNRFRGGIEKDAMPPLHKYLGNPLLTGIGRWFFLYPGGVLMLVGAVMGLWLLPAPRKVGEVTFDVHTLLYAAAFVLLGFQAIAFAVFTKLFAISEGLLPADPTLDRLFRYITLEVGLLVGAILVILGLSTSVYAVGIWGAKHFGLWD